MWFYFRFFNGESSAFFSPAGATGAFSLTSLSSGVGASVFFEGYQDLVLNRDIGGLDDGRGLARVALFRHKHEIESGRISSVGMEVSEV